MGEQDTITLSKDTLYGLVIAVLACLLVMSVFTQGFGLVKTAVPQSNATQQPPPANNSSAANQTQPAGVKAMQLPAMLANAPLMGSPSSAITVLEFSDFQCPYCGIAFGSPWSQDAAYAARFSTISGTVKKVEADYVKTGKAALRHYPVAFLGQESLDASNAALCANAQGKYWEMFDALFTAQTPNEEDGKYSKANLTLIAQNVSGLNMTAFTACLDGDTYVNQVDSLTSDWGTAYRADFCQYHTEVSQCGPGTPMFWIIVDASKTTQAKISTAADAAGFEWGLTSDKSAYIILASPEYAKIQAVMAALA